MDRPTIVIDTNVLVSAARSKRGASAKLLSLVGGDQFEIAVSVPLIVEYEDALERSASVDLTPGSLWSDILDYLCAVGRRHEIHFLWRPMLRDPGDDLVLELAVTSRSESIVTYNKKDFGNLEQFALEVLTPKEFLQKIGVFP